MLDNIYHHSYKGLRESEIDLGILLDIIFDAFKEHDTNCQHKRDSDFEYIKEMNRRPIRYSSAITMLDKAFGTKSIASLSDLDSEALNTLDVNMPTTDADRISTKTVNLLREINERLK